MLSELLLLGGFGDEGTERADGSSLEVCMQRAELDNGIGVQSLNLVRNESRSAMNATDENVKCNCFACFAVGAQPGREGKPWLVCRSEQWQKLNQENVCLIPFIFSSGGIQSVTTNHFHGTQKNPACPQETQLSHKYNVEHPCTLVNHQHACSLQSKIHYRETCLHSHHDSRPKVSKGNLTA